MKHCSKKDLEGRLLNTSTCLPFILSTMGGLCAEAHEFLRICKKRSLTKAEHMMDVLVTQHSRWTARRLHRALFGQCLINFFGSAWTPEASLSEPPHCSMKCKNNNHSSSQLTFKRLAQAFNAASEDPSQSSSDSNVAFPQTTEVFDLSPH